MTVGSHCSAMPMRSRLCRRPRPAAARPAFAVSFSTIDASVTAWRTVRLRAAAACRSSGVNTFSNRADHQPRPASRRRCGAAARRFRETGSLRDPSPRDRARESAPDPRAAWTKDAAVPRPCDSKIFAISAIVSPSGNVTLMTYTSPRAILSMTSNGVIARSNRYSPAFRCRPWRLIQSADAKGQRVANDAGRHQPLADRAAAGARRDLDELLGARRSRDTAASTREIQPAAAAGAASASTNRTRTTRAASSCRSADVSRPIQIVLQDDRGGGRIELRLALAPVRSRDARGGSRLRGSSAARPRSRSAAASAPSARR